MVSTRNHAAVRLPRAARREQLVRVAASTFLTAGYDKTSVDDIARAAGVTRLIVYRIFESKEALYTAVIGDVIDDLAAEFGPTPAAVASDDGRDGRVTALLLGVARRHPDGFRLLWRHMSNQPEFRDTFALFKVAVTEYALQLIAAVSDDRVIARWAAESVVAHVYESICLWLDDGRETMDEQFLVMLANGVRAMVDAWSWSGAS